MPVDDEYIVGLYTHDVPRIGPLVWIAEPTFKGPPTPDDVASIHDWRWPILFPLPAAIRRQVVTAIGIVPTPLKLARFPTMRGGDNVIGWVAFTLEGGEERLLGPTTDRSLPINYLVNDTALRDMIRADWRPEQVW